MPSENDAKLRAFGAVLANLGQALADGIDIGDLDETVAAIQAVGPVAAMLKGPDAARAWFQVTLGILTDIGDDDLSIPAEV